MYCARLHKHAGTTDKREGWNSDVNINFEAKLDYDLESLLTEVMVVIKINPKQTMGGLNQDAAYSAASPCQMNKVWT